MTMRESAHVTFTIESPKLTAKQIEEAIGLKPDISWLAGTVRGAFGSRAKSHGFGLESTLLPSESYDRHLKAMIKRISPYAQKIGALGSELDIELLLSLHRRTGPAVDVAKDDLRWLGVIGARLRIDVQIVGDQPRGASPAKADPAGAKPPSF